MKIRDTDKGEKALLKRARLMGARISVGVHAPAGEEQKEGAEAGITLIQVAQWMEFGTKNCPPRSYIRAWFDENDALAKDAVRRLARQVLDGKITREQALERLGLFFVGKIQARISQGIPPKLADSTVAAKRGSTTPLIDTGQLRSSITHEVK